MLKPPRLENVKILKFGIFCFYIIDYCKNIEDEGGLCIFPVEI